MRSRYVTRDVSGPVAAAVTEVLNHNFPGRDSSLTLHYDFAKQLDLRAYNGVGPTLTFTRATTAAVTDYANVIKTVNSGEARFTGGRRVENLFTYSTNNPPFGAAATTGDATAVHPITGETISDSYGVRSSASVIVDPSSTVTISCYAKASTWGFLALRTINFAAADNFRVWFDLNNGTVESRLPSTYVDHYGIEDVGDGWYRCWAGMTIGADGNGLATFTEASADTSTTAGTSSSETIFIAAPQFENVSGQDDPSPSAYIPTTTAAVAVNYANRRRTNLCLQSQDFSTTWGNANTTESVNATTAPDGTLTADLITSPGTGGGRQMYQLVSGMAPNTYTFSVYAKKGVTDWIALELNNANDYSYFDLTNGVVGTKDSAHDSIAISDEGNGWYRCSITGKTLVTGAQYFVINMAEADGDTTVQAGDTIYLWGAQIELGGSVTAYIPTTTTVASSGFDTDITANRERTNLYTASADFSSPSPWLESLMVVDPADDIANPIDGAINASLMKPDATSSNSHRIYYDMSSTPGQNFVSSVYVKAGGYNFVRISLGGVLTINLATGDVVGTSGITSVTDVGDGWYRISAGTSAATTRTQIVVYNDASLAAYSGDTTSGVYVACAQLEAGATATAYIGTDGAVASVGYGNGISGLLIEEARTNVAHYSQDLSNWAYYAKSTYDTDATAAPDGTTTADRLKDDSSGLTGQIGGNTTVTLPLATSTAYTYSVYLKADALDWAYLEIVAMGAKAVSAYFDLTNGVVGATTGADNTSEFIEDAGNGWYRCGIVFTSDATDTDWKPQMYLAEANGDAVVDADGTSSIFVWGAQLETGAFQLSYIPTVASSVTRNADVVKTTDVSWWSEADSTFYAAATPGTVAKAGRIISLGASGATSNNIEITLQNNAAIYAEHNTAVGNDGASYGTPGQASVGVLTRLAMGVEDNDLAYYADGSAKTPDTTVTVPMSGAAAVDEFHVGKNFTGTTDYFNGHIAEMRSYNVRKDNAVLEDLSNGNIDV